MRIVPGNSYGNAILIWSKGVGWLQVKERGGALRVSCLGRGLNKDLLAIFAARHGITFQDWDQAGQQ